ncbi:MAG: ribonuclease HI, partial [Acidimicrobiales bacterium]|nr:ribonuclease HI [Acidimicrobiales bacterium]
MAKRSTNRTVVYTDGACSGNPGPGGWGWVVPDGRFASGFDPESTNQRMELQ